MIGLVRLRTFALVLWPLLALPVAGWGVCNQCPPERCRVADPPAPMVCPDNAIFCVGQEIDWADEICFKPCDSNYTPPASYWNLCGDVDIDFCADPGRVVDGWCATFTMQGPAHHSTSPGKIVFDEPGIGTVSATVYDLGAPGCHDGEPGQTWPSAAVNFRVVKIDIKTDSNNDGSIDDNDDPIEENPPGRVILYNDDDDNRNHVPDRDESGPVAGEDDLADAYLVYAPTSGLDGYKIRLEASEGEANVRVWDSPSKEHPIALPSDDYTIGTDPIPACVYVEGYRVGEATLDLVLSDPDGNEMCRDRAKFTVFNIKLKQVSFSGANYNYYAVRMDDNSGYYTAPHWQDNSSPLDGDADDPGDRQYPVCFPRNTRMRATVTFIVDPPSALDSPTYVCGMGTDNLNFGADPSTIREATISDDQLTVTDYECDNDFVDEVTWYDPVTITWYVSKGGRWLPRVFHSANEFFITLYGPACSPPFRTVLYLATRNGGTDAATCSARTWAAFSGLDVAGWDESAKAYTRALHYYNTDNGSGAHATAALLSHADGQCDAWADFLAQCFMANNIGGHRSYVHPPPSHTSIVVKNTENDGSPTYPSDAPYEWGLLDIDTSASGIPGQNMTTPAQKWFAGHWLVHVGSVYYDPSYGDAYTSPATELTPQMDYWGRGSQFRLRNAGDGLAVSVTDQVQF